MRKTTFLITSLFVLGFTSLSSGYDIITQPFKGVTRIHRTLDAPRPLNINITIIDLSTDGISFKVNPSNGSSPGEAAAKTVTQWVSDENAQIGINCGFFYWHDGGYDVMGYTASNGNAYSPFEAYAGWPEPYVALHISYWNTPEMIYPRPGEPVGYSTAPLQQTWNAAPGSEWIVKEGAKDVETSWSHSSELHPRTAAGYTQDGNKLILMTVDGRQSGFSEGMTISEVAEHLISLGVYQGINFDGGGSTAMAFADPSVRLVNVPINGGTPYQQRNVPNVLLGYAEINDDTVDECIYADFEDGYEDTFSYSPGYSGSTEGIIASQSTAEPVEANSANGDWCERIFVKDDPVVSAVTENPDGGWFLRWVSGASASPSQNISRQTSGWGGFWAKTETPDVRISLVVDDSENKMERAVAKDMTPDGQWYCYQWNIADDNEWDGWINGDGVIDGETFTIDSIQIFGPDSNAEIYVDKIMHNSKGSIIKIETCQDIRQSYNIMPADLNQDCYVDFLDIGLLAENWLISGSQYDISGNKQPGKVDFSDFSVLSESWFKSNDPQQ